MANKWVTHDHSNYPPGGPESKDYLADADEFNQNYEDICDAVGARYVRGVACENKNSTAATCEIWLRADGGAKDLCDADWYALIYYSTANVWETTVSVSGSDCYIVFGDDELKNPETSGVSDYGATGFIDALHIILFPKKMMLPKEWVITTSGANGGLSSAEIYHEGELLSTFVADIGTRVDVVCDGAGSLNAGVVDSTAIDGLSAVKFDSSVNLLAGGSLEHYGDQHDLLFRVEKTDPPAVKYEIETSETDGSARAQYVDANGSNQGVLLSISPNFAAGILGGKDVAATFRVNTDTVNSLDIGFYDNVAGYQLTTAELSAGSWSDVTVTKTIGTAAAEVKAVIRSNQSCKFYVARGQMNLGTKCFGFSIAPYEDAARILMDTTQDNLFYNGGFERWTLTENNEPPDGWFAVGSAQFTGTPGDTVGAGTGNNSCQATLAANDGMGQYLGLVTDGGTGDLINENILVGLVRGSKVCASVDMMYDATSTGKITLVLGDRVDATTSEETTFDVEPLNEEMRRFTVYKEITPDAKQVYFKIVNDEAATKVVTVDNAMLHVGEFPLMFKPSSGWREMRWDFGMPGIATEGSMTAAGGVIGGNYLVPSGAGGYLILKGTIYAIIEPNGGGNTFKAIVGGTDGLQVTLADGEVDGVNHATGYTTANGFEAKSTIAAACSAVGGGANESEDIVLSLWGYYYAR